MEKVNPPHAIFCYSPALRAIQNDSLNIAVVKPDLSFEAVFLGFPDVTKSTKSTSGFVTMSVNIFWGAVQTNEVVKYYV